VSIAPRDSADYERRGLWVGLAAGLFLVFGGTGFSFFGGPGDLQIWLFVANRLALGVSLLLCLALVVPELRARLGRRFGSEPTLFALAFAAMVAALLLLIASGIEEALDALDEERPFS
jgi:hypothetical protein